MRTLNFRHYTKAFQEGQHLYSIVNFYKQPGYNTRRVEERNRTVLARFSKHIPRLPWIIFAPLAVESLPKIFVCKNNAENAVANETLQVFRFDSSMTGGLS